MLGTILNFLKMTGFKTYVVGVGMIAEGIYLCTEGNVTEGVVLINAGFLALTGRAALQKVIDK